MNVVINRVAPYKPPTSATTQACEFARARCSKDNRTDTQTPTAAGGPAKLYNKHGTAAGSKQLLYQQLLRVLNESIFKCVQRYWCFIDTLLSIVKQMVVKDQCIPF